MTGGQTSIGRRRGAELRKADGGSRHARAVALGALVALLGSSVSCAGPRRDIVLVSLDSVRADDFERALAEAPKLDARLEGSLVLANAYTPMPFTLPAHMSVLSGLAPRVHGVDRGDRALSPAVRTLPELLASAGYRTGAVVNSGWLAPEFGFGRGFERYEVVPTSLRAAPNVARAAASWLAGVPRGDSAFLFVHLYDAHSDPAEEGNRLAYSAPSAVKLDGETARPDESDCDPLGRCATDFLIGAVRERRALEPRQLDGLRSSYRRGVVALLHDLDELLRQLEASGRLSSALVVVFADHGEEFQEHGSLLHSQAYEETARIPLLIRAPGPPRGTETASCAELADLFTTVLAWSGAAVEVPEAQRAGLNLLSADRESLDCAKREIVVQDKLHRRRFALRRGNWKLHLDRRDRAVELYDVANDRGETVDLAEREPALARELARAIEERIARDRALAARYGLAPIQREGLTPDAESELRALGYLR